MNYLSISTLNEYFNNEYLRGLLEDLQALRKQAITLIAPEAYDAVVSAVENEDYHATMNAMLSSDDEQITVLAHFIDLDPSASGIEDSSNIDNLIELAEVHELILDHTYGSDIESTTLIADDTFSDYIRDIEVSSGNIAPHLAELFPWEQYADAARIDYEQVTVNAPNTLGLDDADFYIRK